MAVSVVEVAVKGPTGPPGPPGLNPRGPYSPLDTYMLRDAVTRAGITYLYVGKQPGSDQPPSSNWAVLVESGDKHYQHTQAVASNEWLVTHNLDKHPAVSVIDSSGAEVEGCVEHLDNNTIRIRFSAIFAGIATLN
ncbi:MAG: hypothetical protein KAG66_00510 [Methylococcales bacterium]|nr:hypothetical protein [Methylococcales bacterium]